MKRQTVSESIKRLAFAAMLTAMSVVIGIFCKTALNFADGLFRVTFENLPIILAGIMFGPIVGGTVGVASDLLSYLLSGQTYPPNLVVTVGAAVIGIISGVVARFIVRRRGVLQFAVAGAAAHIVGSLVIKSAGLFVFYNWLVLWRIPTYMIIAPLEVLMLTLLYKNKAVRRIIDKIALVKSSSDAETKGRASISYDEAIEYIHSVSSAFCKPGLERIGELCRRLGNPERDLKFIHVGGTNGKGSVCSMLSSVLSRAGLKVGLFTSPYIVEFGERMRIGGENIPRETLAGLVEEIKPIAEAMEDKPTEFELITAIALLYYKRAAVDVVVLEVGLGGRLDSTNIIEAPLCSVITGISLDHTAILGNTVEEIAYEKAGIIKHGCPVISGCRDEAAAKVIREQAALRESRFIGVDYSGLTVGASDLSGTEFSYNNFENMKISLLGSYQPRNAAIVLEVISLLRELGYELCDDAVRQGLLSARWPARFEIISTEPRVIFDGAHNPEGIEAATESITTYLGGERIYLISGVLRDKDYMKIARTVSEVAHRAYTITPNNPRALTAEEYAEILSGEGVAASPMPDIESAVRTALDDARMDGATVVCLGSLYTYGDIIKIIGAYGENNNGKNNL